MEIIDIYFCKFDTSNNKIHTLVDLNLTFTLMNYVSLKKKKLLYGKLIPREGEKRNKFYAVFGLRQLIAVTTRVTCNISTSTDG